MLLVASVLTLLVGLMHSVLGGTRLIAPITKLDGLPVILGSRRLSVITLHAGWHALTLAYWGIAALLALMYWTPHARSEPFFWMVALVFGVTGLAALFLSRGRHLSWMFFLPVALIAGIEAMH